MSIYVGIDVGKFFHVAYCLDERGNRLGTLKFDNDRTGFTELEKLVGKFSIPDNSHIFWVWKLPAITGFPSMSCSKIRDTK